MPSHREVELLQRLIQAVLPAGTVIALAYGSDSGGNEPAVGLEIELATPRQFVRVELRDADRASGDQCELLVLRRAPLTLHDELRAADRQFVDVARGVVRLRLPWAFIDRTGVALPAFARTIAARPDRDPFGDRASLVSRLLVEQPVRRWGTREMAECAGVSTMTASHALRQLRERGLLDAQMRGRSLAVRIARVRALVEHWTHHYDWRRSASLTVQAPIGNLQRFVSRLPAAFDGRRWALAMQSGAHLVAPHAAWDSVHVYVDVPRAEMLADVARAAGWEPGPGKLILMRPWHAQSAWCGMRIVHELPVVSDLQLILDLWHYPVRGREQAEILLAALEARVDIERAAAEHVNAL